MTIKAVLTASSLCLLLGAVFICVHASVLVGAPGGGSPPRATTAVLCIELSPDGGSLFVSRGPCSHKADSSGHTGGGADRFRVCDEELKAAQAECKTLKNPQARGRCEGQAVGKYVACLFDKTYPE